MNHSLSLNYLIDILPTQHQTRYHLRTANNIPPITARTQMYQNPFLPATISITNDLPLNVRGLPSLTSFKQSLNSNMSKPKSIFSFGSRRAQILHTRLRLGCSSLNFHLHGRIVDSPLSICGSVETVNHFLLHRPLLADIRLPFLSDMSFPPILQNFSLKIKIYQHIKVIFSRVKDYIIASMWFG